MKLMESMKTKTNSTKSNNISFSYIHSKSSLTKEKEKDKLNNLNHQNKNIYLKSRRSLSLSTGTDDKKDDETKEVLSMKNLNLFCNINAEWNIVLKVESKNVGNNCNGINLLKNNIRLDKDFNNSVLTQKNINNINNYILHDIKNKNFSHNNNKLEVYNSYIIYDKIKDIEKKSKEKDLLKGLPPKIPSLLDHIFSLSGKDENKFIHNDCFIKLNKSTFPNNFYNHYMEICNKTKKEISYNSCSTTSRIKNKLLTILYYFPEKKNQM
jgi:hypothetical protein